MIKHLFTTIFLLVFFSNNTTGLNENSFNKFNLSAQKIITINDIFALKNHSLEQIHDFLILKDWVYDSSDYKRGSLPYHHGVKTSIYKNNYYDLKFTISETTIFKDKSRTMIDKITYYVSVETESPELHKYFLKDLYKNNFISKGEASTGGDISIASSTPSALEERLKREFVRLEYSSRNYFNGKNTVSISISVYKKFDYYEGMLRKDVYALEVFL